MYNDHAALYYLLLNKWEMGQLQVTPPIVRLPRLSQGGIPPVIPHISIEATDLGSTTPETSPRAKNPFKNVPPGETQEESDDFLRDPTLARYLRHGRRHTLGAAQHHDLISPDELNQLQLRKISECSSSQTSSGLGSEASNSQFPTQPCPLQLALNLGTGLESSSQTSMGSSKATNRYLQIPAKHSRMEKRRASDGGPYAHAYKLFLDMRNSQLSQIDSTCELDSRGHSTSHTSSIKQLFEDKKAQYGRLPPAGANRKEWLQFKNQQVGVVVSLSKHLGVITWFCPVGWWIS